MPVGSTVLHAPSGTFIRSPHGDDLVMNVVQITSVTVEDWNDVATDRRFVEAEHGGEWRLVQFRSTSWLRVECDSAGDVTGFSGLGLSTHHDPATGAIAVRSVPEATSTKFRPVCIAP
jgi:hypothetical protein